MHIHDSDRRGTIIVLGGWEGDEALPAAELFVALAASARLHALHITTVAQATCLRHSLDDLALGDVTLVAQAGSAGSAAKAARPLAVTATASTAPQPVLYIHVNPL